MKTVSTRFNLIQRSKCQRILRVSAYICRQNIYDVTFGESYRYKHKQDLYKCGVLAPDGTPLNLQNNTNLWTSIQRRETGKKSQLARHCRVSFPKNIPADISEIILMELCSEELVSRGMIVNYAIHDMSGNNPHAHLLMPLRKVDSFGQWSVKIREWNKPALAQDFRKSFANKCNEYYELSGMPDRLSATKNTDQNQRDEQQLHMGPVVHRKLINEDEISPRSSTYFIARGNKEIEELEDQKQLILVRLKLKISAMNSILPQQLRIPFPWNIQASSIEPNTNISPDLLPLMPLLPRLNSGVISQSPRYLTQRITEIEPSVPNLSSGPIGPA